MALQYAVRHLLVDVNPSLVYKTSQFVGYADGVNITRESMQTVEKICAELEEISKTVGLTINTTKTNVLIQSRIYLICQQMEGQDIEAVDGYRRRNRINKTK